ncbi:MAG: hypothetical protein AAFQ41_04790 [Cyanobacteria bacterium J06623_7]
MSRNDKFKQDRYQLITELVQKLLKVDKEQQRQTTIEQIASIILRSRPFGRRFQDTPLQGIYLELYLQAKQELIAHLNQQLAQALKDMQLGHEPSLEGLQPVYLYELQTQFFKHILGDRELKKLGLTAQGYALNSELRTYALTELVKAIKFSGRLCKPHRQKFSPPLFRILYEEAKTETLCYICLNIDLYDPNRGDRKFMNWVNFKLDKTMLKCYEAHHRHAQFEFPSSQTLEQIPQATAAPDLTQMLREYISRDPEGIFNTTHIRNRPDASFAKIALAKFSGQTWEQVSQQIDIPVPTLSSFYNRWCRRFTPLLNQELKQYF